MLAVTAVTARVAAAQPTPAAGGESWVLEVSYEWHRDQFRYSFDNPSSFDTPFLVPHNYTQRYWADHHWAVAKARYVALGSTFTTEFGATPRQRRRASDIDTFHNPGSDVITSGTDGDADLRAWRFAQWSHGRIAGVPIRVGYRFRRDHADFHPDDVVVTHSNPASTARHFTTDQEFTTSQIQELAIETGAAWQPSAIWRVALTANASPWLAGTLTTELPQKYPGQELVSTAYAAAVGAGLQAEVSRGRATVVFGVEWGDTVSYRPSRAIERDVLAVSVGMRWK